MPETQITPRYVPVGADAIGDPEGDVDVGPIVLGTNRRGASERTRGDPWISPRQVQDASTHVVAVLRSKHVGLLSAPATGRG